MCGEIKEVLQNFNMSNPFCDNSNNKEKMDRLISATGRPKFAGSGFYETDYKKKNVAEDKDNKK